MNAGLLCSEDKEAIEDSGPKLLRHNHFQTFLFVGLHPNRFEVLPEEASTR